MDKYSLIIIGIIIGVAWFNFGERFDVSKLTPRCWEILHYTNKERVPLFLVHIKSLLVGLLLIILGFTENQYKNEIIILIGGAIIGLHVNQFLNEQYLIDNKQQNRSLNSSLLNNRTMLYAYT